MIASDNAQPPLRKNAILLCADENYAMYALALIKQLAAAGLQDTADICLVSEHKITPLASLASLPVRYLQISPETGGIDFPVRGHLNFATYLRLFAITELADSYRRILYLDSDIYLARPGLERLFDVHIPPRYAIAAVRDRPQQLMLSRRMEEAFVRDLPAFPYFNAGVMLVDTGRWQEQDMLARALVQIREHPDAILLSDQSALNLSLPGDWAELSWEWNLMCQPDFAWVTMRGPAVLIHFAGTHKPWGKRRSAYPAHIVKWYDDFLDAHFQVTPPPPTKDTSLRRRMFQILGVPKRARRNLRTFWRVRRYRRRFASKTDVVDPRR